MTTPHQSDVEVVFAAGGVLWRETSLGYKLAIVHRVAYDDWTLPKGRLKPGEGWLQAAQREVQEETQCRVRVGTFAGGQVYTAHGKPKVVLYWHMYLVEEGEFIPNDEVDVLLWVLPEDALPILSYENERRLVAGEH